jgi:hypothetical protein
VSQGEERGLEREAGSKAGEEGEHKEIKMLHMNLEGISTLR